MIPKLSHALMLGSVFCKMDPGNISTCAIGSSLQAIGTNQQDIEFDGYTEFALAWPWVGSCLPHEVNLLADAGIYFYPHLRAVHYTHVIFQWFDQYVCTGRMTLEELADVIAIIEPDCDCHRFDCDCAKQAIESPAECVTV